MECEPQAQRGDAAAGFEGARKVLCAFIPDMVVCQIEVSELAMLRECPREVHDATITNIVAVELQRYQAGVLLQPMFIKLLSN